MMLQRTKIDWLRMGDRNNSFFHAYLKIKHKAKSVRIIHKVDGTILPQKIYIT